MIQIAICDDNQTDLQQLKEILKDVMGKYSICYNIHEYDSGEKLLETQNVFHLIFLDIVMNGKDGVEVGKQIYWRNQSTKIIFQTYFAQFCKDAMNRSHAFAFLEKPLQTDEVEEQIKEFLESYNGSQEITVEFKNVRYLIDEKERSKASLILPVKDIIYFEYLKKQQEIKIITEGQEYKYWGTINKLEEKMRPLGFETNCRGIMVNMERITKIKRYLIYLDTGDMLPLSQRRVKFFKERVNEYLHDSF